LGRIQEKGGDWNCMRISCSDLGPILLNYFTPVTFCIQRKRKQFPNFYSSSVFIKKSIVNYSDWK
jgi:hypothetical protein